MACKVLKKEGSILFSVVSIISILGIIVFMVEVALTPLSAEQRRLDLTEDRLNEVKKAIFCFINNYGEPDIKDNLIKNLLKRPEGFKLWHYDSFWAGYRGERYLYAPAGQPDPYEKYLDGFGAPVEVLFEDEKITISASHDIEEVSFWKREVEIRLGVSKAQEHPEGQAYGAGKAQVSEEDTINTITIKLRLTYPEKGNLSFEEEEREIDLINGKGSADYTFSKKRFPAGIRKIEIILVHKAQGTCAQEELIEVDVLRIPPARTDSAYRKELKVSIG